MGLQSALSAAKILGGIARFQRNAFVSTRTTNVASTVGHQKNVSRSVESPQSAGRWKRSLHWQTALSPAPLHWVVIVRVLRAKTKRIDGIDGSLLCVEYDNMGEPYREGVRIGIEHDGRTVSALLDVKDVRGLVNALDPFYNTTPEAKTEWEQRTYNLLFDVRERLGKLRDRKSIREQNDEEEIDAIGGMVNHAIGLLIGTSR